MLELHELDVARNDVEARKVGFLDDGSDVDALVVIADRAQQSAILGNIEFGLQAMKCAEGRLGIKVDGENPVAHQGEILRKMGRGRCLARTTLEVDHRNDLEVLARSAANAIALAAFRAFIEEVAHRLDVVERV